MALSEEHNIYEFFFGSKFNETGKDIILPWKSKNSEHIIHPGDRIYLPVQLDSYDASQDPKTEILFMGGALGGSKSHAGRAITMCKLIEWSPLRGKGMVPDEPIKGAIFSENYPVLRGRHIDTISNWPSWLGKYYKSDKMFVTGNGNAHLKLLNLDRPDKYASDQFAVAFIDESTFNTEKTFNDVDSRVRWPGLSALMIAASNPGRQGHAFTKKRFVNEKTRDRGVVFVPSTLKDNPFLNSDPKYLEKLKRYPPKLVKAWVEGSWDQFEGQFFPDLTEEVHLVPPFRIPQEWMRFRVIDHGFKHPTAVLWGAVDPKGNLYIYLTFEALETTADVNKKIVHDISSDWRINYGLPAGGKVKTESYVATIGDPSLKRVDGSALGNKTPWEVYNDMNDGIGSFYVVEAERDRVEGWHSLQRAFHYEIDSEESEKQDTTIFKTKPQIFIFDLPSQIAYLGQRSIHAGNALWEELQGLVYDEKKATEDAAKSKGYYDIGEGDDLPECLRYLWAQVGVTDLSHLEMQRMEMMMPNKSEEFLTDQQTEYNERLLAGTIF